MAGQFTVDRDGTEPDEAPFYLMLQGRVRDHVHLPFQ